MKRGLALSTSRSSLCSVDLVSEIAAERNLSSSPRPKEALLSVLSPRAKYARSDSVPECTQEIARAHRLIRRGSIDLSSLDLQELYLSAHTGTADARGTTREILSPSRITYRPFAQLFTFPLDGSTQLGSARRGVIWKFSIDAMQISGRVFRKINTITFVRDESLVVSHRSNCKSTSVLFVWKLRED